MTKMDDVMSWDLRVRAMGDLVKHDFIEAEIDGDEKTVRFFDNRRIKEMAWEADPETGKLLPVRTEAII